MILHSKFRVHIQLVDIELDYEGDMDGKLLVSLIVEKYCKETGFEYNGSWSKCLKKAGLDRKNCQRRV